MTEKWLEGVGDVFDAINARWSEENSKRAEAEWAAMQRFNEQRRQEQLKQKA